MKFNLKAVIIKSGRVLAVASNKHVPYLNDFKRGSRELWNINCCAEKGAILKVLKMYDGLKHLAGSIIYVSRFNKQGGTLLAKPCKHCDEFIRHVGIKKIIYTTQSGTKEIKI
jgi:deoxycytidylate deaminase